MFSFVLESAVAGEDFEVKREAVLGNVLGEAVNAPELLAGFVVEGVRHSDEDSRRAVDANYATGSIVAGSR